MTKQQVLREKPLKTFTLLSRQHELLSHLAGNMPYLFKNRFPRGAAMKAATKDFCYQQPGIDTATIYVTQHPLQPAQDVHVFHIARKQKASPAIEKFKEKPFRWVGSVCKLRTEKYR